jgi:phosphoribosylaminoimidazole-succinocarboxamide synthase
MELLRNGKTKDVYTLPDGNILLRFNDTVTGNADGSRDPGGNLVVGTETGTGQNALAVSIHYFELLNKKKVNTHFLSAELGKNEMTVRPARLFGKGLEFVLRYKATGSFVRRFGEFCADGAALTPPVFEVTLKDDGRDDPPVTEDILELLKIMDKKTYADVKKQTVSVCDIIRDDLGKKGLELVDIKLEFGLDKTGKVMLIDEISGGNMRVYRAGKKLNYPTLSALILE